MPRENKRLLTSIALIDEMFKIAGHEIRYEDIKDDKSEWYLKYTMTEEQNKIWREWGLKLIKKKLRLPAKVAKTEMAMFDLCYGLKIKNNKEQEDGEV